MITQKDYKQTIIIGMVLLAYTHVLWEINNSINFTLTYYSYSPDKYRLQEQVFLFLNRRILGLSFMTLTALSFFVVFMSIYVLIGPLDDKQLLDFILLMSIFLVHANMNNSLMYLLIILVIVTNKDWLSVGLIFIKEISFYLIWLYLFITEPTKRKKLIVYVFLASFIYIIIRFIVIGNVPVYHNGLWVPWLFNLHVLLENWFAIIYTIILGIYFIPKKYYKLVILYSIPILFFSMFWETQLWFPLLMLCFSEQIKERK